MAGEKRVLGSDSSDELPSQPATRVKKPERRLQIANASISDTGTGTKGDNSLEEIVVQCLPVSSSRLRSTVQRANTLPPHQPPISNNPVQRSKTEPHLDSRSNPSTPKKNVRRQEPSGSNVGRSRVISISTDDSATDEETALSSPASNASSPVFSRRFPSSLPRERAPSRPSPARQGNRGDEGQGQTESQCSMSGAYKDRYDHRTPTARFVQGSKIPGNAISVSPSKKAINTSGTSFQSTTRYGTRCQHQPAEKVVRGSSSSKNRPPSIQRGTANPTSHSPRNRNESRLLPPTSGSSQLTYVSDDEHPAAGSAHLTGGSDYYTPSSRNSEMSDTDSKPPRRASSPALKWKGKRRASPLPSSSPKLGSSVRGSRSPSPSSPAESSPQNPNSASGPSHKKRGDRHPRSPSPGDNVNSRERTQPQDPGQSLGQDICHCTGPCPSCHKPRFSFSHQPHPLMFPPVQYPYLYFLPPHVQTGYHLTNHGPPPNSYPHAIPQHFDLLPSISSAQPPPLHFGYPVSQMLASHPPTAHPPVHASPAPIPMPSSPAPAPSASVPAPSLSPVVDSLPMDSPATKQLPSELLDALDQFYQPPQRAVKVVDPSCDPRSP